MEKNIDQNKYRLDGNPRNFIDDSKLGSPRDISLNQMDEQIRTLQAMAGKNCESIVGNHAKAPPNSR